MFYNRKGDTTCLRSISPFTFLITFEKKLSIMRFLLKLLFAAFFILKLANVHPFYGWSWFLIFAPLAVHWLRVYRDWETDRKSTRLNSSNRSLSRMPSSA